MSLINEALKKAQRQRTETPDALLPPLPGGGGRISKRGMPMGAQTIALIAAGCIVLIVLSVGGTIFLVRSTSRKNEPTAGASVAPVVSPVAVNVEKKTAGAPPQSPLSSPGAQNAEPNPISIAPIITPIIAATPPAEPPVSPPSQPAAPTVPGHQDERVHAYLDALRVTGIRSSGTGSRVLMNEHVYRVNDVVDRGLGLKLTEVQSDALIFTDRNGVTYAKQF
jgi:hypothetical protein